ncbi:MAG: flagellar hook-associated protein FlgK [Frankiales bacterium]|nr:flagellar hook-associated protein FlgK [Frankiales bacterium]
MSSFSSLGIGVSALTAAQRAVETAAHNVANAGTAGYTRQRLAVQTATPTPGTAGLRGDGMRGTGVTVVSIERLRDRLADVSFRSETGVEAAASARAEGLSRTESVLGPYGSGTPEALTRFLGAWDGLSLNPSDGAARSTVLSTGEGLADSVRASAEGLDAVSAELTTRVDDNLGELNGLLSHVVELNKTVKRAEIGGSEPNDLLDERDTALDRIVALTGATVSLDDAGMPQVHLGGVPLVAGGTAAKLQRTGTGDTVQLQTADGTALAPGGLLGGYLSVVKSDIPELSQQLDGLANALRTRVNDLHAQSTDLNGEAGAEMFTGTGAHDLRLGNLTESQVAASRTGKVADGEGALAMSALRTEPLVGSQPLGAAMRAFAAKVGQSVTDATRNATTAKSGLDAAALTRASSNGVNVDEEMVDLVKYQHAYSAASRVITVVDEMLDKIINGMGH